MLSALYSFFVRYWFKIFGSLLQLACFLLHRISFEFICLVCNGFFYVLFLNHFPFDLLPSPLQFFPLFLILFWLVVSLSAKRLLSFPKSSSILLSSFTCCLKSSISVLLLVSSSCFCFLRVIVETALVSPGHWQSFTKSSLREVSSFFFLQIFTSLTIRPTRPWKRRRCSSTTASLANLSHTWYAASWRTRPRKRTSPSEGWQVRAPLRSIFDPFLCIRIASHHRQALYKRQLLSPSREDKHQRWPCVRPRAPHSATPLEEKLRNKRDRSFENAGPGLRTERERESSWRLDSPRQDKSGRTRCASALIVRPRSDRRPTSLRTQRLHRKRSWIQEEEVRRSQSQRDRSF